MKGVPTTPSDTWFQGLEFPSRLFGSGSTDSELYEEDGEFVLSVEMPGFDVDDIDVSWDDGQLFIAAEREDQTVGEQRTYHRRFRFPKTVDDEDITAEYTNGVLSVRLPIEHGIARGEPIEVQG